MKELAGKLRSTAFSLDLTCDRALASFETEAGKSLFVRDCSVAKAALRALAEIIEIKPHVIRYFDAESYKSDNVPAIDGRLVIDIIRQYGLEV